MAAVLVTGGAGFIGSNIVARLAPKGPVYVCDRLGDAGDAKWKNLAKHDFAGIVAPEGLDAFLADKGADLAAIVHMGAISATTETDVDLIYDTNVRLSQRLWDWCAHHRKRLVYASSAATYGDGDRGFEDSNDYAATLSLRPLNAYGWSKKVFDLYALREAAAGRCPPRWAGLRFFNVYGPNEQHKGAQMSVVAHMFPRVAAGERVRLFRSHNPAYPDGGQKRDFVAVRDCADIVEWLLETDVQAGIINVGTGQARTFLELAEALFAALHGPHAVDFVDTPEEIRAKYQYFTQADMSRLRSLGYERQFTPIEQGVADYALNYLSTDDPHV
ncbi:MAG: ADP-glyceromanno-heptose 6-epimerase [Hyphomonadaceae bacterium]|nr:ADP-glyceromanno-heptose 6-epimerase [Hyphomonadaceae bacterium]